MTLRTKLKDALESPRSRIFFIVNDTLAALTLLSVLSIVLETVSTLEQFEPLFRSIEYITVAAFTAEYAARFYVTRRRWQYAFSFFGVIDLLAIVPTYLGIGNLTYLKSARILRILRFLRILRLAKIGRSHILKHVSPVALNISIYVTALISAIIIFGTLIYIAEPESISFANIPLGMLWAAKALLGGLGGSTESQVPITQTGQIIALFARFTGLLLIGLLISVMGNIMRYVLTGARR